MLESWAGLMLELGRLNVGVLGRFDVGVLGRFNVGVLGRLDVEVTYGDEKEMLLLVVVQGKGPSLFGRDWLARLKLDWKTIYLLNCPLLEATTVTL